MFSKILFIETQGNDGIEFLVKGKEAEGVISIFVTGMSFFINMY